MEESMMIPYKPGRPHKYDPSKPHSLQPPALPGEYRIRNADQEITYIGIASNLNRRMKQHMKSGKMLIADKGGDTFEFQIAKAGTQFEDLCAHERNKIEKHHPKANKRAGGGGRRTWI